MKKVLVTGSSGYIGQHLCKMITLLRPDIELYRFDQNEKNTDFTFQGDITNPGCFHRISDIDFDAVVHLAAEVKVGESVLEPWLYFNTNVNGTHNALQHLTYDNFIFASTGAAANATSPYGLSKRAAEDVVRAHIKTCNHDAKQFKDMTIFRFFNVIGSDGYAPTNPEGLLLNLRKAVDTGVFNLFGDDYDTKDGSCVREYIHVNDICSSVIKALFHPTNNIENLAYNDTRTVKEIIDIYKTVNGVDFNVYVLPRRSGDLPESNLAVPSELMVRSYTYEQMLLDIYK